MVHRRNQVFRRERDTVEKPYLWAPGAWTCPLKTGETIIRISGTGFGVAPKANGAKSFCKHQVQAGK
ncbi:MAG: hypothetical protein M3421_07450 [Bacteroidota bacterium]|nr:hypothetical protein [Bacteroidota bacterium]